MEMYFGQFWIREDKQIIDLKRLIMKELKV